MTLADLTADLVWPRLLRVGHLALRPSRIGMAMVFIIGMMLLVVLADKLDGKPNENSLLESAKVEALNVVAMCAGPDSADRGRDAERVGTQVFVSYVGVPAYLVRESPWMALVVLPLMACWIAVTGGAISRSAACDFAQGVSIEWPQAVGFALSRWVSLVMALVGPLLIVWVMALGMAAVGWALFSLPVVGVVGAFLWPLFLFGGLIAAVVMLAYAFGAPMLVPSVTCEGTDAVDAVQHAYSFVFARPLRLAVYLVILIVQLAVMGAIVAAVFWLAVHFAQACGMVWSGVRGGEILGVLPGHAVSVGEPTTGGGTKLARGLASLWTLIPVTIPVAFVVSFVWSGSTVLYLAMRRVVDGQDMSEIWMPGVVAGTQARATVAAAATVVAAKGEAVVENGPADET